MRLIIRLRDINSVQMTKERKSPDVAKLIRVVQVIPGRLLAVHLVNNLQCLG
ncbi:MAG: hypothetical protein BWY44_00248 [Candidatus Omnitrophica bacterium ADurb.Bin292]|nr:MAG: hypothetical protein BWY44_00248 [Candidatus Omnitrophica bacterium ADurb.Bin292]